MLETLVRYVHFIGILTLAATLFHEYLSLKPATPAATIQRLARVDAVYGLSALTVLAAGLALWFLVGKPASFYSGNVLFHLKLGLFVVIGVLSIYPTVFLLRQRNADAGTVVVPRRLLLVLKVEMAMLVLMPLLAVLMARGYGLP